MQLVLARNTKITYLIFKATAHMTGNTFSHISVSKKIILNSVVLKTLVYGSIYFYKEYKMFVHFKDIFKV